MILIEKYSSAVNNMPTVLIVAKVKKTTFAACLEIVRRSAHLVIKIIVHFRILVNHPHTKVLL